MKLANHSLWLVCGGAALAIHAGAAALFYAGNSEDPVPLGQKGVLVELAFEGAASGGRAQTGNVKEQTNAQAEKVEAAPPKKAEQARPFEPKPADVKPEPEKPQPEYPKPEPITPPEPEPTPRDDVPATPAAEPVEQLVNDVTSTSIANEVGTEDGANTEAVTNSIGGAGGKNAAAKGNKGDGNAAQSGGSGGVIKSYEDLVQVWVHKHLLYPKSARRRQLTGTVLVRFTLTAKGQLGSAEIVEESPYKILNRSALKTIRRAVPFPSFPKEITEESRVFIIPIEYKAG